MIAVNVVFEYAEDFDRERVVTVAAKTRAMFEGMPGLRLKVFTVDAAHRRAANVYLWDSEEAAGAFFTPELAAQVAELYGVTPRVEFAEVLEVVDNMHP